MRSGWRQVKRNRGARGLSLSALLLVFLTALAGNGCDNSSVTTTATPRRAKPTTYPSTRPALPIAPAQAAVAPNVPPASYLYFQYPEEVEAPETVKSNVGKPNGWGTPVPFPMARLRLVSRGDESVSAMLFSDDPKEAIDKEWTGDRYYFQMPLNQVTDLSKLDGAEWGVMASKSENADREESGNGIFLHGDRYHLEPVNFVVHFDGIPDKKGGVQVRIAGQFFQYDNQNPSAPPPLVTVVATLMPKVETKE